MDWGKNAPSTKVQNYLNIFHDFIRENHSAATEEDEFIMDEWLKLKKMIENNPNNTRLLDNHISKISVGYSEIKSVKSYTNINSF